MISRRALIKIDCTQRTLAVPAHLYDMLIIQGHGA
jgi:hypothetical protein